MLAIDLKPSGGARGQVFVSDYVRDGLNAPTDFDFPDNLALDKAGNLYITEDPGGSSSTGKTIGDDVWFAPFNPSSSAHAQPIVRFLSIDRLRCRANRYLLEPDRQDPVHRCPTPGRLGSARPLDRRAALQQRAVPADQ